MRYKKSFSAGWMKLNIKREVKFLYIVLNIFFTMYILNLSVSGSHGFCKQVVCHLSGDDKTCCSDNKCSSILLFKFNMIYMLSSFM
jgi:hypothetical protein